MKVKVHNSLKPPLEYNQDQMPSTNQGCLLHLSFYENSFDQPILIHIYSPSANSVTHLY